MPGEQDTETAPVPAGTESASFGAVVLFQACGGVHGQTASLQY